MSTFPDPMCNSTRRKLLVMLKVPIEIDLDVLGLPPTYSHQVEGQEVFTQVEDSESVAMINEVSQTDLDVDVQISSNQLVGCIEQGGQVLYAESRTQHEQDNPGNYEENTAAERNCLDTLLPEEGLAPIQLQISSLENKRMGNLLDLFDLVNDSIAYSVNTIGTILRLGKLANYSQEGIFKRVSRGSY